MNKKITIPTENGQEMVCSIFYPEKIQGKNPAVLFIPGWTSNESSYHAQAQALTKLGYICLAITLRGHGESSGKLEDFSRNDHIADTIHAYDFLKSQKHVDPKNISVVGASYGGYLSAVLAGKRPIRHLALRAPAIYDNKNMHTPTSQLLDEREDEFFKNLHIEKDNLATTGVKNISGELLVIESEKDQIIPSHIVSLFLTTANKKTAITHKIMHGADHQLSTGEWKQQFIDLLVEFFKKQYKK